MMILIVEVEAVENLMSISGFIKFLFFWVIMVIVWLFAISITIIALFFTQVSILLHNLSEVSKNLYFYFNKITKNI